VNDDEIATRVSAYYTQKLREFGETPRGVDWNSESAQNVRFDQVLSVVPASESFSINDFGCGYGALFDRVSRMSSLVAYVGYDISPAMVGAARARYGNAGIARFVDRYSEVPVADYTVASGVFSVKGETSVSDWRRYVFATLDLLRDRSIHGFAFNALTSYSDRERMRDDLFYADPHELFDLCRTRYARNVALLHDYGIYEFTIRVRLD
jgi:SAM-dependent methyltransferase